MVAKGIVIDGKEKAYMWKEKSGLDDQWRRLLDTATGSAPDYQSLEPRMAWLSRTLHEIEKRPLRQPGSWRLPRLWRSIASSSVRRRARRQIF